MAKGSIARWRANFLTGLAVVLPAVISIAVLVWLFGTVSSITDILLFFLPRQWTHERSGEGPVYWYWSLAALALAVLGVTAIGRMTRYYIGRKFIETMDQLLRAVPLLNKIYSTIQQVNEAFSTSKKSSFKQVVLIQYPREGIYSIAFVTSDNHPEAASRIGKKMLGVFVATTPNPTSGFLLVVPEDQVIKLEMSVAEGIKYIISLGAIVPPYSPLPGGGAEARPVLPPPSDPPA